jgi:hypothetical protein
MILFRPNLRITVFALSLLFPLMISATSGNQAHHFEYSERAVEEALAPAQQLECYLQYHPDASYAELAARPETASLVEGISAQPRVEEEGRDFDVLAFFVGLGVGCLVSLGISLLAFL